MRKLLLLPLTLPLAAARGALDGASRALLDAIASAPEPPPPVWPMPEEPLFEEEPESPVEEEPAPPLRDEPTRGEVNRRREALREAEGGGPGGVGAEIRIEAPWEGYEGMSVAEVLDRLVGADEATRAVVRLYEAANRNRAPVLRATEL